MISKSELKYYISLKKKKVRKNEGVFLIEGTKLVHDAFASDYRIEKVFYTEEYKRHNPDIIQEFKSHKMDLSIIRGKDLARLTETETPQGIVAAVDMPESADLPVSPRIIALEHIADPGNLGTIIRSCDWFGFDEILISGESVEIYNSKVIRSTMGSFFHIKMFQVDDFYKVINKYRKKGYRLIVADLEGADVNEIEIPPKYLLLFSNESVGPTKEILSTADAKVTIRKFGNAESLNVANAASVILSHFAYKFSSGEDK